MASNGHIRSEGLFLPFPLPHQPSFIKRLWDHSLPLLPAFLSVVCLLTDPVFIHSCWLAPQCLCPALQVCEFPVTISLVYPALTNWFHSQDLSKISLYPCMTFMQVLGAEDFFPLPLQDQELKHLLQLSWSVPHFPWAEGHPSASLHEAQGFCIVLLSLAAETYVWGPFHDWIPPCVVAVVSVFETTSFCPVCMPTSLAIIASSSSFPLPRSDHVTWQLLYVYHYDMNLFW